MSDIGGGSARATALARSLDQVQSMLAAQRLDEAMALARSALAQGLEAPLLLNLRAFDLERQARFPEALGMLDRALDLAPDDLLILTAVGRCLSMQGRAGAALAAYDHVLALSDLHAPAQYGRGLALSGLHREAEALACYRRAAALDPNYPDPPGALADAALKAGDVAEARRQAERALMLDPLQPAANLTLALISAQEGDGDGALARIEHVLRNARLAPLHAASFERLYGDQLDRAQRYAAAFEAYARANDALWRVYGVGLDAPELESGEAMCRRLHGYFASAPAADWRGAPTGEAVVGAASGARSPRPATPPDARGHAFLVGFVRSGTTLLEQVLASHPDVVALEERPTLRALVGDRFDSEQALDRLAHLDSAQADALRAEYWDKVRSFGIDARGKVFVDKAPLTTLWQPLIAKLFPDAVILFARRDPRDVVLSSFRHAFQVNALTGAFVDLERSAAFYDGVMSLAEVYRRVLLLRVHAFRHEDLVADFDLEVGKICDALGLPWDEAMRGFSETARRRDVRTPSALQVRETLNAKGVGHWRNYRTPMAPVLARLAPWVARFGYPPD